MARSKAPQAKKKIGGPRVKGEPRPEKVDAVRKIKDRFGSSAAVLLTEYRGLTVKDLAELRAGLRKVSADYKVVKNTLACIAAKEAGLADIASALEGPTALVFADGDPVAAAKHLAEFAKRVPALVVKGGVLEGRALSPESAKALATIEPREVLLAKVAGMMIAPAQQLVGLFAAPLRQLGSVLAQLRDQLEKEGAAPEGATG